MKKIIAMSALILLLFPSFTYAKKKEYTYEKAILQKVESKTYVRSIDYIDPYYYYRYGFGFHMRAMPRTSTYTFLTLAYKDLEIITQTASSFYADEFIVKDPIEIRFDEKKKRIMVKRPNGKELKLRILKQERVNKKRR